MRFVAIRTRRRAWLVLGAVAALVIGAASVNPRELYDQMYPVEALKRDVFRICQDTDSSFIRALASDRKQCFNSMPHAIALAIGWARPRSMTWAEALRDPWHNAELLLALTATPPRQAVVTPRTAAEAGWARGLGAGCHDDATGTAPSLRVAAAIDPVARLAGEPPAARAGNAGDALPIVPLAGDRSISMTMPAPAAAADAAPAIGFGTASGPDIGSHSGTAIVPLPISAGCGSGA